MQCVNYHHAVCQLSSGIVSVSIMQCVSDHHAECQLSSYFLSVIFRVSISHAMCNIVTTFYQFDFIDKVQRSSFLYWTAAP